MRPARSLAAALLFLGVLIAGILGGCAGPKRVAAPRDVFRGLWITRWDYRSSEDVDRCLDEAARLGVTDVFFQVRGQADAFYRSALEPWGHQLGGDPGFDPLARAVRRAHRRGLRLHAWVNVYPLWKGLEPPADPDHAWRRHPDWRLHDDSGRAQPLNDHYVVADPTLPAVQDHIAAVLVDLCSRYEVDGLHLDYVRFVSDRLDLVQLWPGDDASLARWRAAGGVGDPRTEPETRARHRAWIRGEITLLVRRLSRECRAVRPDIEMSAAVLRRPDRARDSYLQDAVAWLDEGLVDRIMPMIYTRDIQRFTTDLAAWRAVAPGPRISPGIGVYKHEPSDLAPQMAATTGTAGWSLFAYSSLVESADPEQDHGKVARQRRRDLRAVVAGD